MSLSTFFRSLSKSTLIVNINAFHVLLCCSDKIFLCFLFLLLWNQSLIYSYLTHFPDLHFHYLFLLVKYLLLHFRDNWRPIIIEFRDEDSSFTSKDLLHSSIYCLNMLHSSWSILPAIPFSFQEIWHLLPILV